MKLDTILAAAAPLGVLAFVITGVDQHSLAFAAAIGLLVTFSYLGLVVIACLAIDFVRGARRGLHSEREIRRWAREVNR